MYTDLAIRVTLIAGSSTAPNVRYVPPVLLLTLDSATSFTPAYWESQGAQRSRIDELLIPTDALCIADTVRIRCPDYLDVRLDSHNLTLKSLKAEVTLLLQCEPCQPLLVATNINLNFEKLFLAIEPDSLVSSANRIFPDM